MARNYQIGEAVEIIANGEDAEALQDLGRRYPLLVTKVAKATAGSNVKEVVELFSYMPDYLSANKVNKTIKQALISEDAADDAEDVEEKPAKKAPAKKKAAKKEDGPYDGKNAADLFRECKERGIKVAPRKTAKYYKDLLIKADAEAAEAEDADDDWGDEEEEETPKKPVKKGRTRVGSKKKKPEPEPVEDDDDEDDDDDWDI